VSQCVRCRKSAPSQDADESAGWIFTGHPTEAIICPHCQTPTEARAHRDNAAIARMEADFDDDPAAD
jgi:hypothetical protein